MMGWIMKRVVGSAGPYIVGGLLALLALSSATAGVQSWRVGRLKADVSAEKLAQVNPVTGKSWKAEAERDAKALDLCQNRVAGLEGDIARQNGEIERWRADGARLEILAARAARDLQSARAVAESKSRAVMDFAVDGATCEAREAAMLKLAEGALK